VLIGNALAEQDGSRLGAADAVGRVLELSRSARPALALASVALDLLVRRPALADAALAHAFAQPLSSISAHTFSVLDAARLGDPPPAHELSEETDEVHPLK
jgi:hypothetical protein